MTRNTEPASQSLHVVSRPVGGWHLLTIKGCIGATSNLAEVLNEVEQCLARGQLKIALAFPSNTYLHTFAIRTLIVCCESVGGKAGELGILMPTRQIREILNTLELSDLLTLFDSEDDLAQA